MRKQTLAVSLCVLLVAASAAGAASYNDVNTISTATTDTTTRVGYNYLTAPSYLTITSDGSLSTTTLDIGYGSSASYYGTIGTLEAQGDLTASSTVYIGRDGVGTLLINGGDVLFNSYLYTCRFSTGSSASAAITINSGSLTVAGTANFSYTASGGTTTITQTGGTVDFNGVVNLGYASGSTASYAISGGSLEIYQLYVGTSSGAVGRFDVIGSLATILLNHGTYNSLNTFAASTLGFTIDAGGVSTIVSNRTSLGGGTIDMDIAAGVTLLDGATFDLIYDSDGSITITNLSLSSEDVYVDGSGEAGWTLQNNGSGTLQAVYHAAVPEPATMGLVGLGILGLTLKRRRAA